MILFVCSHTLTCIHLKIIPSLWFTLWSVNSPHSDSSSGLVPFSTRLSCASVVRTNTHMRLWFNSVSSTQRITPNTRLRRQISVGVYCGFYLCHILLELLIETLMIRVVRSKHSTSVSAGSLRCELSWKRNVTWIRQRWFVKWGLNLVQNNLEMSWYVWPVETHSIKNIDFNSNI